MVNQRLIFWSIVLLAFLVGAARGQGPCNCEVVNRGEPVQGGASCNWPGQGSLPCFTVAFSSVSGVPPEPGKCQLLEICEQPRDCTYQTVKAIVTVAPCAAICMGSPSLEALKDGVQFQDRIIMSPGGTYEVPVDAGNVTTFCGTKEQAKTVRLTSPKGRIVLEIRFIFGCLQCTAIAGDGG